MPTGKVKSICWVDELTSVNKRLTNPGSSKDIVFVRVPVADEVLSVIAPSFIGTALFFHHLTLAEAKNWTAAWLTGSYWVYAIGSMTASLTFGPIIDRVTATKAVPFFLLPKICALMIIWIFNDPIWAWPYLLLLGLNVGMTYTGLTALWAELYGTQHLGAIRSLIVAITVLASALGPPVMGLMIDTGVSMGSICGIFAIYCSIATIFIFIGLRTSSKTI